jgi:tyrosyl-tRNA synthetase
MLKIAEFLAAGCEVTVLLADVHGFLDNLKAPIELIEHRAKYYNFCITETLRAVGVDVSRLKFVLGSSYQTTGPRGAQYFMDLLRLSTAVSGHDATKAGSEVVKQVDSPPLSSQIYPLMQALDEEYLGVDAQFGGVDQRKIFTLAVEALPRVGFTKRAHLMNPLIPGLQEGGKMSSSDLDSKIDLIDTPETIRKKMKKAFCPPKQVEGNGVLSFVEYVLLPASALRSPSGQPSFRVPRRDQDDLIYSDIAAMHADYLADILQPQTLKPATTEALLEILEPIQKAFEASEEWKATEKKAYPPPAPPPAKKKKEKKIGTRFPGAAGGAAAGKAEGEAEADGAEVVQARADGSVEGPGAQEVSVGKGAEEALGKLALAAEGVQQSSSSPS